MKNLSRSIAFATLLAVTGAASAAPAAPAAPDAASHAAPYAAPYAASDAAAQAASRAAAPSAAAVGASQALATSKPEGFVSNKQSVDMLFRALSGKMSKSVVLSPKAKAYKVSGAFDMDSPFSVLERVSRDLGLIWYYDGQVIYVYDPTEIRSAVLALEHISLKELETHLRNAGLYDKRYELRGARGARTVYVSGPPKYVEIVTSTAKFLDQGERRAASETPTRRIESIRVKNAFVTDRSYERRDRTVVMPGITTVLREVLERSAVNAQVTIAASSAPEAAAAAAGAPLTQNTAADLSAAALGRAPGAALLPPGAAPAASSAMTSLAGETPAGGRATERLAVVAYPDTNSLVVSGTPDQITMIRNLVATLDVPRQQIEMSLWIIDVAKTDFEQLGAKWSGVLKVGGVGGISVNAPTSIPPGTATQFLATVGALRDQGKAQVVTRPVVVTQENIPAIFDNSKTFYVRLIGERETSLQNVTYGTMVSVVPKFDPAGQRIEMALDIEDGSTVADEQGQTQVTGLPVVGRTRINTVARVSHGNSLLIGGYTRDQATNSVQSVPGLSRIPVVGKLFQYRDTGNTQSVRLFLIQPKALADAAAFTPEHVMEHDAAVDSAVERLKRDLQ